MFILCPTYRGSMGIHYSAKMEWDYMSTKLTSLGASSITIAKYRRLADSVYKY
jgi:hypothetical protein